MGSYALGFLATGGIFLVILLIVRAVEPKLEAKFMDITINKILGKWNEEEDYIAQMEKERQATNDDVAPESKTTVKDIFEKEVDHESKH